MRKYDYHARNFAQWMRTNLVVDDIMKHIACSQENQLLIKLISGLSAQLVTTPLLLPTKSWQLTPDRVLSSTFLGSSPDELQERFDLKLTDICFYIHVYVSILPLSLSRHCVFLILWPIYHQFRLRIALTLLLPKNGKMKLLSPNCIWHLLPSRLKYGPR